MSYALDHAVESFCDFLIVHHSDDKEVATEASAEFDSLSDFIFSWPEAPDGAGIHDCAEDFQMFQSVLIWIIAEWHQGLQEEGNKPVLRIPRKITKIFKDEEARDTLLDPNWFKWQVVSTRETLRRNSLPS